MGQFFDTTRDSFFQGNPGDDLFIFGFGGGGSDTIIGGGGNDVIAVVVHSASFLSDQLVTDFSYGDSIQVSAEGGLVLSIIDGDGSNIQPYTAQVVSNGEFTTFIADGNGDSLADIHIKFPGVFSAADFSIAHLSGGINLTEFTLIDIPPSPPTTPTSSDDFLNGIVFSNNGDEIPIDNVFSGLDGNDTILGAAGNDLLTGNKGNDSIKGGADNDTLTGGEGNDFVQGNQGNDSVYGGTGNDTVRGGKHDDGVFGEALDDFVAGDRGNDQVYGGTGYDTLRGGKDDDRLFGEGGNDVILGDKGDDTMWGGNGKDAFGFFADSGVDVIKDFQQGMDLIGIASELYSTKKEAVDAFSDGILDLGEANTVTLIGTTSVTESDFVIV